MNGDFAHRHLDVRMDVRPEMWIFREAGSGPVVTAGVSCGNVIVEAPKFSHWRPSL